MYFREVTINYVQAGWLHASMPGENRVFGIFYLIGANLRWSLRQASSSTRAMHRCIATHRDLL
jgi:hypothetical protein